MTELVLQKQSDNILLCLDTETLRALPTPLVVTVKEKTLTHAQRGALHVWCDQVATVLNDNNLFYTWIYPITGVEIEVEWDKMKVKEHLYKPTQANLLGKLSTEDQSTVEPSVIVNAIHRAFAMHKGIYLPDWPSARG